MRGAQKVSHWLRAPTGQVVNSNRVRSVASNARHTSFLRSISSAVEPIASAVVVCLSGIAAHSNQSLKNSVAAMVDSLRPGHEPGNVRTVLREGVVAKPLRPASTASRCLIRSCASAARAFTPTPRPLVVRCASAPIAIPTPPNGQNRWTPADKVMHHCPALSF